MSKEKLSVNLETKGNWVLDFRYKNRLLTRDFVRSLMHKQLKSLNDDALDLFEEVLRDEFQQRAVPRKLEVDPWGNNAA